MLAKLVVLSLITAALVVPVYGQEPAQQEPIVLSIDEAIATAIANSPGLAIAKEQVERAENQVAEARGLARFRVDATASTSRISPTSTFTIPGPGGEPTVIETRPSSSTGAQATISQPIDISGRLSLARQIANLQLDVQEYGEAQSLQQLIVAVKEAYYTVLRAQGNVEVAQSAVNVAEERLRLARAQFEAGVSPRFDVTTAEVDVANRRQTLIQAESNVEAARGLLNRAMGISVNTPIVVQDQVVPVEPVTIDIPARTAEAIERRPEVRQARLGVELAERNVRFVGTEDDPSLAAFVSADWTSDTSTFSPNNTTYTYGARVTWPIFTGGVTRARVDQARNDVNIARENLDQTVLGVELEVRTSALNVMEASSRVQTALANVGLAQEALRLARVRFQEGVSTAVEVTTAEDALTQAMTNVVSARYDYLTALAGLQRATASQPEYARFAPVAAPSAPVEPTSPATPAVPGETTPEGANR